MSAAHASLSPDARPRIVDLATVDWTQADEHLAYRPRQRPGRQHSMGLVKFMFPNQYHVYLPGDPAL